MPFLAAVTSNPAALIGLNSGRITEGAPADLIIFNPNAPWVCDSDKLLSRSKNTPLDGRRMTGRNLKTIVGGRVVFDSSL
jgi:dihydroorotase